MGLLEVTPPAAEPVELSVVKEQLRLIDADDDAYLIRLISTVRRLVETDMHRALITRSLKLVLDGFPNSRILPLPMPPLLAVSAVEYYAPGATTLSTYASTNYRVFADREPGRIVLRDGCSWPDVWRDGGAVHVSYTAGFGATAAAVPEDIQHGMLLLIGHYWANREETFTGPAVLQIPKGAETLLGPWRCYQ